MKIDVSEYVQGSIDTLISENLVECKYELLEKAINQWIEEYFENLPIDIGWHLRNDSRLQKLIDQAELQSEQLILNTQLPSKNSVFNRQLIPENNVLAR